eukprot:7209718-Alexandrium_andersonii.AAC.1
MANDRASYENMLRARQLRSAQWPTDIFTPASLNKLRVAFRQQKALLLLSPEAAHGAALEYLAKGAIRRLSGFMDVLVFVSLTCASPSVLRGP